jgi:hypothetical protein
MIIWCNKKCAGEQGHLEDSFQKKIYKSYDKRKFYQFIKISKRREQRDFLRWGKKCVIAKPKTGIDKNHLYN